MGTCSLRTYTAQNVQIIGCLGSLYAAAQYAGPWLNLSVAVLNTGQDGESGQDNIAKMLNSFRETLGIGHGTLPRWVQQHSSLPVLRPHVEEPKDTYGYLASDREIARHMTSLKEGRATPNYILFCNGDTFYAQELLLQRVSSWFKRLASLAWIGSPPYVMYRTGASGAVSLGWRRGSEWSASPYAHTAQCRRQLWSTAHPVFRKRQEKVQQNQQPSLLDV